MPPPFCRSNMNPRANIHTLYREIARRESSTWPDLKESEEFQDVRVYLGRGKESLPLINSQTPIESTPKSAERMRSILKS